MLDREAFNRSYRIVFLQMTPGSSDESCHRIGRFIRRTLGISVLGVSG